MFLWIPCLTLLVLTEHLPQAKPSIVHTRAKADSPAAIIEAETEMHYRVRGAESIEKKSRRNKRNAWDDCFDSGDDPAKVIHKVGEIVEGVLDFGLPIPPTFSTINLIKELHDNDKCDGISLWQYINNHIRNTVREAFTNKFKRTSQSISEHRESTMKRFKARLEWVEEGNRTQTELKGVIDDIHEYLANIDPEDRFNFYRYRSIYNFDYGLATWYYVDLVHKKMVLEMMMGLCQKLNEQSGDPKYRTSTYADQLQEYQRKWLKFAQMEAPLAMKELFWKGYQCHRKNHYTNIFNNWALPRRVSHPYLECRDVFGNVWDQYWTDGYYSRDGYGMATRFTFFDEPAKSRDPEEIQKPVADWMLKNFSQKIKLLVGQGDRRNPGNALPPATFPGNCKSPCRLQDTDYKWCIIGIKGHHGGGWKRC